MHGLINKAFQSFLTDTFGTSVWHAVLHRAGLWDDVGIEGFDPLHRYDPAVAQAMLAAASAELGRPSGQLLEDLGTWLVSNPRTEALRRLLRFGGLSYADFLGSLDDLHGRARLAVPDLDLPELSIRAHGGGRFDLICRACPQGFGYAMLGLLRSLADDYGALAVIELEAGPTDGACDLRRRGDERLRIEVHDPAFHSGRRFDLSAMVPEGGP